MRALIAGAGPAVERVSGALSKASPGIRLSLTVSGARVRRAAGEGFECIVICCPLSDEQGDGAAMRVLTAGNAACVVMAPPGAEAELARKLESAGAAVVPAEAGEEELCRAIRLTLGARRRSLGESEPPLKPIEDIRLQNRAKQAVMSYMGFSEEQAHRYLERQAMDLRLTKTEAARRLLRLYGSDERRGNN